MWRRRRAGDGGLARTRAVFPQPAVALVTVVLAVLAMLSLWEHASPPRALLPQAWLTLALTGAVALTYRFPIHARHQTKIYLSTAVYFLLAVLVPPPLAVAAAGLGALAGEVSRRAMSGNLASDIATEVGRRVLIMVPVVLVAQMSVMPAFISVVGAALLLGVLDLVSLALVLAPIAGDRPLHAMLLTAHDTARAELALYAVAIVGAMAAQHQLWTLPLLVVPGGMVYLAFKGQMELQQSTLHLLEGMADAVDLRDAYTGGHSRRVTEHCARILSELGMRGPEVDLVLASARVHDIGKIGVPDVVLHKPGPLTDEERALMDRHPVHGAELLKRHRGFSGGVAIVRHHHERWDGRGYPAGIAGLDIPFGARVIAVADSYDAMTSDRPYRAGMTARRAAEILRNGRTSQWDAAIVDAFLRAIEDALQTEGSEEAAPAEARAGVARAPAYLGASAAMMQPVGLALRGSERL